MKGVGWRGGGGQDVGILARQLCANFRPKIGGGKCSYCCTSLNISQILSFFAIIPQVCFSTHGVSSAIFVFFYLLISFSLSLHSLLELGIDSFFLVLIIDSAIVKFFSLIIDNPIVFLSEWSDNC